MVDQIPQATRREVFGNTEEKYVAPTRGPEAVQAAQESFFSMPTSQKMAELTKHCYMPV